VIKCNLRYSRRISEVLLVGQKEARLFKKDFRDRTGHFLEQAIGELFGSSPQHPEPLFM
jgi:hypothetical protein